MTYIPPEVKDKTDRELAEMMNRLVEQRRDVNYQIDQIKAEREVRNQKFLRFRRLELMANHILPFEGGYADLAANEFANGNLPKGDEDAAMHLAMLARDAGC